MPLANKQLSEVTVGDLMVYNAELVKSKVIGWLKAHMLGIRAFFDGLSYLTMAKAVVFSATTVVLLRTLYFLYCEALKKYYGVEEVASIEIDDTIAPVGKYMMYSRNGEHMHCVKTRIDNKYYIVPLPEAIVIRLTTSKSDSLSLDEMAVSGSEKHVVDSLPPFQVKFVTNVDGPFTLIGMGFRVGDYLITAYHVYGEVLAKYAASPDNVFVQGKNFQAKFLNMTIAFRTNVDVVGLYIPANYSSTLGLSKGVLTPLLNGSYLTIYGTNECFKPARSKGMCLGAKEKDKPYLFDHAITTQPGDSGSPILDSRNRIVGVHLGRNEFKSNRGVALDFLPFLDVVGLDESSQDGEQLKMFKSKVMHREDYAEYLENRGELKMSKEYELSVERFSGISGERPKKYYGFRHAAGVALVKPIEKYDFEHSWADMMDQEDARGWKGESLKPELAQPLVAPVKTAAVESKVMALSDPTILDPALEEFRKLQKMAFEEPSSSLLNENFVVPSRISKLNESVPPVVASEERVDFRASHVTGVTKTPVNPVEPKPLPSILKVRSTVVSEKSEPAMPLTALNPEVVKKTPSKKKSKH